MNNVNMWMYHVEVAFAVLFIIYDVIMLLLPKKHPRPKYYLFGAIFGVAFLLLSDVAVAIVDGRSGILVYYVERVCNFTYYLSNYTIMWVIVHYALERVKHNGGKVKKYARWVNQGVYICSILLLVANCFVPFIYRVDKNNMYHRGDWLLLALVPIGIMIVQLIEILIRYKNNLSSFERLMIFSYIAFPLVAEVFQIVEPGFSWQPLAMILAVCIIISQNFIASERGRSIEEENQIRQEGKELQTRIILFVCAMIVVFFGVVARVAVSFASTQMNQEVEAHYQMLANKTTEEATGWIVRETQILLDQKAALEINSRFDKKFLENYFEHIVNDYNVDNNIYDLYFVDKHNQQSSGSGYDPDGGIDFRSREWYQGAVATEGVCYTEPYIDSYTGKYVVTLSTKVHSRTQGFVGVLAIDIMADKLFAITNDPSLPENSYLFLVDDDLCLVTHPNEAYGYVDEAPQRITDLQNEGFPALVNLLQGIKEKGQSEGSISFKDYDGISRSFFASRIEDCGWYVVAAISEDVIKQTKDNMSRGIFVALIICLVLGMVITLWATNSMIRKLTEAREEAKAASEAKSRFLANMSHEIRTPINAVLGMDEILLRECTDENIKEYARNIQSAGQALLGVVNDILDFSKIESDRLDIIPVEYILGELVGSCVNLIQFRAKDKNLSFTLEREDYLPKQLKGDVIRVRQIIANLLTNAVKYTKEGGITLGIGWNPGKDDRGELVIRVKDTGIGIKEESLPDLFTSFQRLEEKRNRNIEGTGLGLSITKQLVELMGGEIEVHSEYGKGSEFVIKVPQIVVDNANTESFDVVQETSKPATKELKTQNAKILVVDDVVMNLKVVKGLLKKTGIEVDMAERGTIALDMIKESDYDMIFLDHMMPELDGVETLRVIKKDYPDVYEKTPVIMLTANAVMGVEEEYMKEGFAGYLSKPIDREALCNCIEKHLAKEKMI